MKPSERITAIAKEKASNTWVHSGECSRQFRSADDYLQIALEMPVFCMNVLITYLDEEYEKKQNLEQFDKDFAVHDAESKLQ